LPNESITFVSLFDHNYAIKGVAMVHSFLEYNPKYNIKILCLDVQTNIILNDLFQDDSRIELYTLSDLDEIAINSILGNRTYQEFCWSLASIFSKFVILNYGNSVIYLDSDIYFFGDIEPILQEIKGYSIAVTPHRFSKHLEHLRTVGNFNVQFCYFKNDYIGYEVSNEWAKQCIANCSIDLENGIYGDQKYLDEWPLKYSPSFKAIENIGAGTAPWNFDQYKILKVSDQITVDQYPLIFFHFHGLLLTKNGAEVIQPDIYSPFNQDVYKKYFDSLNSIRSNRFFQSKFPAKFELPL
jgi:hypothetical protein